MCARVIQLKYVRGYYEPVTPADAVGVDVFKATVGLSRKARFSRAQIPHLRRFAPDYGFHIKIRTARSLKAVQP